MESLYHRFLNHYWGSYTKLIVDESIALFLNLWIYLVLGIVLTSLIKMYLNKEQVAGFLQRKTNITIILAALVGVISPLGSYIVIPLSAALFIMGVPLPVLMALLVSSPLIDPNLFLLTAGAFGFEIAFARLISAFLLGTLAGYTTKWLLEKQNIQLYAILNPENTASLISISDNYIRPTFNKFFNELYRMTLFISKYFFLAILLAAVIKILTPPNLMIKLFGQNNFLSVLLSTGAGIPFYVCGGAAIPVVEQLADLGMSKGAVLAFFISGPVTKISNLILMNAIFRVRVFIVYLTVGIFGAVILGLIYNLFI
jgi:uncharacterized protein